MLSGEGWARIKLGEVGPATSLLDQARELAEGPSHSDLDRGEIVYRLGVARYLVSSIATAIALFDEALMLVERSETPSDSLRAWILFVALSLLPATAGLSGGTRRHRVRP